MNFLRLFRFAVDVGPVHDSFKQARCVPNAATAFVSCNMQNVEDLNGVVRNIGNRVLIWLCCAPRNVRAVPSGKVR